MEWRNTPQAIDGSARRPGMFESHAHLRSFDHRVNAAIESKTRRATPLRRTTPHATATTATGGRRTDAQNTAVASTATTAAAANANTLLNSVAQVKSA